MQSQKRSSVTAGAGYTGHNGAHRRICIRICICAMVCARMYRHTTELQQEELQQEKYKEIQLNKTGRGFCPHEVLCLQGLFVPKTRKGRAPFSHVTQTQGRQQRQTAENTAKHPAEKTAGTTAKILQRRLQGQRQRILQCISNAILVHIVILVHIRAFMGRAY